MHHTTVQCVREQEKIWMNTSKKILQFAGPESKSHWVQSDKSAAWTEWGEKATRERKKEHHTHAHTLTERSKNHFLLASGVDLFWRTRFFIPCQCDGALVLALAFGSWLTLNHLVFGQKYFSAATSFHIQFVLKFRCDRYALLDKHRDTKKEKDFRFSFE